MNSSSSSTSAQGGTSARIRSMACVVFRLARVSRRKAVCSASIVAVWRSRGAPGRCGSRRRPRSPRLLTVMRERQHVLHDDAVAADESVPADAAELVDAAEGADIDPVARW